jgi:cell division protein ZapB
MLPAGTIMLSPLLRMLTPEPAALYIALMSGNLGNERFDLELKRLEKRLDELVVVCKKLQDENESLRSRQDALTADRATLLQKNEQVRGRVEAMITRLKAMEQSS